MSLAAALAVVSASLILMLGVNASRISLAQNGLPSVLHRRVFVHVQLYTLQGHLHSITEASIIYNML